MNIIYESYLEDLMSKRINVKYEGKPCYDIVIESQFEGLLDEIEKLNLINQKLCIVTDSNTGAIYLEILTALLKTRCGQVTSFLFEAGEEQKSLDTVSLLYTHLIEQKLGRKDILLALGGGVVGDLTGFTAATYLRGIDFIQVPTTLLSQVDSSIGGKTGVDFQQYKNMVGAFKMPRLVYMNLSVLKTLEPRQFYSGFAESMKAALIKDANFYVWLIDHMYEICEGDQEVLEELIYQSCLIKKTVVEKDPTEQGDRALLNLGHTVGHAIEKAMNFKLYHGECVALGCVVAAYISWKKEYLSMEEYYEIRDMFVPFQLPITIKGMEPSRIVELTKSDKKMVSGHLNFILLKKIGKAFIDTSVTEEEILAGVKEIYYDENDCE